MLSAIIEYAPEITACDAMMVASAARTIIGNSPHVGTIR